MIGGISQKHARQKQHSCQKKQAGEKNCRHRDARRWTEFRAVDHFEERNQIETVKQSVRVETVIENCVGLLAECGCPEQCQRQVQQIEPDHIALAASRNVCAGRQQTCFIIPQHHFSPKPRTNQASERRADSGTSSSS